MSESNAGSASQRPYRDAHVRLSDGRKLGYAELGVPDGFPLLWFPGLPGCCRHAHPADVAITRRHGVRLICVERPGFGLSDPRPDATLLSHADDIAELADALGLERFAIAGVSGGGPWLLACAHQLPQRVCCVGLIGCGGPPDAPGAQQGMAPERRRFVALFRRFPGLAAALMRLLGLHRDPERFYARMSQGLDDTDLARLRSDDVWRRRVDNVREAMRQGPGAFAREVHLFLRPWGFDLTDVRVPARAFPEGRVGRVPASRLKKTARGVCRWPP